MSFRAMSAPNDAPWSDAANDLQVALEEARVPLLTRTRTRCERAFILRLGLWLLASCVQRSDERCWGGLGFDCHLWVLHRLLIPPQSDLENCARCKVRHE